MKSEEQPIFYSNLKGVLEFYKKAKEFSLENPQYKADIEWQNSRDITKLTDIDFYLEYVWVVLCSHNRVSTARKFYNLWYDEPTNFELIPYLKKRKAIEYGMKHYMTWFKQLMECDSNEKKLEFMETLNFIGPITKFHLAKSIGLPYAKPDIHLSRIATYFGFLDDDELWVQDMCRLISENSGDKISTVDLIIWRYCEQHPNYKIEMQ